MKEIPVVEREHLINFCQKVLQHYGIASESARCTAEVLVCADARGVPSHGVSHLSRHVADIREGLTRKDTQRVCLAETPAIALYDANFGLGAVNSRFAMQLAMDKAWQCGVGVVSMKNSCHHGITAYYAMMAMKEGMIGLALTNTAALAVPTNGLQARFGTNPIAFAVPALQEVPFVLDMSTTVVTRGAIEICYKTHQDIPEGWAVDKNGHSPKEPLQFLDDLLNLEGGLLSLGGDGVSRGGHKGYGLGVMVDILSAVLAGGKFGIQVRDTKETASSVSHFFLALDISAFRPLQDFQKDMDEMLSTLRNTKPKHGIEKVIYAGLLANEREELANKEGVPLLPQVLQELLNIGGELGIELNFSLLERP